MAGLSANRASWTIPLLAAVTAVVIALPSVKLGLQFDDYWYKAIITNTPIFTESLPFELNPTILSDGDPERNHGLMEIGLLPWWTSKNFGLAFWRPVTHWTHRLDFWLWPKKPAWMHCQSLLWFALLGTVVALLYLEILGTHWQTALASVLFVLDTTHVMPVSWLANRSHLPAATFAALSLFVYICSRRVSWESCKLRQTVLVSLSCLCLLLGLLSNESAVGITGYLFAYALWLDKGSWKARALSLSPYVVLIVVWRLLYRMYGYGVTDSGKYMDPLLYPVLFLRSLPGRFLEYSLPHWTAPFFIFDLSSLSQIALQLSIIIPFGMCLLPYLRRDRKLLFWTTGMLVVFIPAATATAKARLLILAGIGTMGIISLFAEKALYGNSKAPFGRIQPFVEIPVLLSLLVCHLLISPYLFRTKLSGRMDYKVRNDLIIDTAPIDDRVKDQTVILINAPSLYLGTLLGTMRAGREKSVPGRIRCLSESNIPVLLKRLDAQSLSIVYPEGLPVKRTRGMDCPCYVGMEVHLSDVSFFVKEVDKQGRPQVVYCRFHIPLDDPSLVWLSFHGTKYQLVAPPPVGESLLFEA